MEHGVHAEHVAQKPYVSFRTPTYFIGGSNFSLPRQGGFICLVICAALLFVRIIHKKRIQETFGASGSRMLRQGDSRHPLHFFNLQEFSVLSNTPSIPLTPTH